MAITSLASLKNYLKNTSYDVTFIHLNTNSIVTNIESSIATINQKYSTNYEYIEINRDQSANEIYTHYIIYPSLLSFKKINYTDLRNPIPYEILSDTVPLYDMIVRSLESTIQTMYDLKLYLKNTLYDITFIRLYKNSSLKGIYIKYILDDLNKIYKKNYNYIEINTDEINSTYEVLVKNLPALISFRKNRYNDIDYYIPCRIISGDSLPILKDFLTVSLNY
jgi:hypothetical protein